MAVQMLLRAPGMSQNVPFTWTYIDRPLEGQLYLLFMAQNVQFPNDGVRWQEAETKFNLTADNTNQRELEVHEIKFGFIPGSDDQNAWRVRRRFRLSKGGMPSLWIVHYTRGNGAPIMPSLMNQPVRAYPLRPINEPALFIAGEKMGQKVYPPGAGPPPGGRGGPGPGMPGAPGMPMNMHQQQAMLAQQNNRMEMMDGRRDQRGRTGSTARPPQMPDEDSGDEGEMISTKNLALTRYKRNHDLMNEVFMHAAFGDKKKPPPPSPYSIFDKSELEEQTAKLNAEIEELQARSLARKSKQSTGDVAMSEPITA
ncbi:hypothetical protein V5O48_004835 [Marasmius crinis-equi]|uniref:SWI/SNF and RSC complexes subunit Ssr4 N-terminal domain-containing protein n=1 Tax=Marasmius crinis-equi TaxID=585013 RepID=A0ABR3FP91_9AGAR